MDGIFIAIIIIVSLLVLIGILMFAFASVCYATVFNRVPPKISSLLVHDNSEPSKDEVKQERLKTETLAFLANDPQSFDIETVSHDGLKLYARYVPADRKIDKNITVHLVHGFRGEPAGDFCGTIQYYHNLGFNVSLPDDRAHRKSEGKYLGFGWLDRLDTVAWCKKLVEMNGEDSIIILHGVSMGAATVMMASGEADLPAQVKAIIEDCGYTSVLDILDHTIPVQAPILKKPLLRIASALSKAKNGFRLEEASSLEQLKKNTRPMLFIHGDADDFVPFRMVHENFNACMAKKDIFITNGVTHARSHSHDIDMYCRKIGSFLRENIEKDLQI